MGGLVGCAGALLMAAATGGAALVPALLLLALGGHYAGRASVEAVVLSEHFGTLSVTRDRWWTSSTRTFPLADVTARYYAHASLRSTKHHRLALGYRGRPVALLDPKQGYDRAGIERFHAAHAAAIARASGANASRISRLVERWFKQWMKSLRLIHRAFAFANNQARDGCQGRK